MRSGVYAEKKGKQKKQKRLCPLFFVGIDIELPTPLLRLLALSGGEHPWNKPFHFDKIIAVMMEDQGRKLGIGFVRTRPAAASVRGQYIVGNPT